MNTRIKKMRLSPVLSSIAVCSLMSFVLVTSSLAHQQTTSLDQDFENAIKFYETARFAEAAEAFKHSIKRNPNNPEAYYYLANSYFRMYRQKEAVKAYKQAIELKPDHYLAYNNLGTAYHMLGDFKAALTAYQKAIEVKPDYPEAIFGLGVVYLELKDKDAALEQHKRLVAIDIERADKLYRYINDNKISLPILNEKALSLPKPLYPTQARVAHVSGPVIVWVSIDETGKVISASAVTGHVLLRAAAVAAAKLARFTPMRVNGEFVKVTGLITYAFLPEDKPPMSPQR